MSASLWHCALPCTLHESFASRSLFILFLLLRNSSPAQPSKHLSSLWSTVSTGIVVILLLLWQNIWHKQPKKGMVYSTHNWRVEPVMLRMACQWEGMTCYGRKEAAGLGSSQVSETNTDPHLVSYISPFHSPQDGTTWSCSGYPHKENDIPSSSSHSSGKDGASWACPLLMMKLETPILLSTNSLCALMHAMAVSSLDDGILWHSSHSKAWIFFLPSLLWWSLSLWGCCWWCMCPA